MSAIEPVWPQGVEPVTRRRPIRPVREHDERDDRERPHSGREEPGGEPPEDSGESGEHVDVKG